MYYLREVDPARLATYLLLSLAWSAGGWLLVARGFGLKSRERLLAGAAAGLLLFIVVSNLLARAMPLPAAFGTAALAILGAGVLSHALPGAGRTPLRGDLRHLWLLAGFVLAALAFQSVQRGLALFDEYLHLPLVSVMATGDIPPHFFLNPAQPFAYHYGLQIWAASMVRLAGFFPWSAFDLSRAMALALTACLAWLWFRRTVRSEIAALVSAAVLLVAGGSRWLLLFLPARLLAELSRHVDLINTGANTASTLVEALGRPWTLEGGGLVPFPFAFHNGIFVPLVFSLGSTGAMPHFTVLLLLLLAARIKPGWRSAAITALLLASLALSAEHLFVLLWLGLAGLGLWSVVRRGESRRSHPSPRWWAGVLGASGVLAIVQGGFLTVAAQRVWEGLARLQASVVSNYYGFALRWPPALASAHFAELSAGDGWQMLALLAELGPGLLLAPLVTLYAWRQARVGRWMRAGLGIAAALSFVAAWFIRYGVDRSMTRLPATSLWLWLALGLPWVWLARPARSGVATALVAGFVAVVSLGGVTIGAIELTSIPTPQYSYFLEAMDAEMSARYWDRLPDRAQVLDRVAPRSVTLFGRPSTSFAGIYDSLPEWRALVANPASAEVARAGYAFVYFDQGWWGDLDPSVRATYKNPCVSLVDEVVWKNVQFRRLYDVRGCAPSALLSIPDLTPEPPLLNGEGATCRPRTGVSPRRGRLATTGLPSPGLKLALSSLLQKRGEWGKPTDGGSAILEHERCPLARSSPFPLREGGAGG